MNYKFWAILWLIIAAVISIGVYFVDNEKTATMMTIGFWCSLVMATIILKG